MCVCNRLCIFKSQAGFSSKVQVEKGLSEWNGCISVGLAVLNYKYMEDNEENTHPHPHLTTQLKTSFLDSPSLPSPGGSSAPATRCYLRGPEVLFCAPASPRASALMGLRPRTLRTRSGLGLVSRLGGTARSPPAPKLRALLSFPHIQVSNRSEQSRSPSSCPMSGYFVTKQGWTQLC